MTLEQIVSIVGATSQCVSQDSLKQDFLYVFACDLMSDVLAMVQKETDKVILITGLANSQVIRTAEMLDLQFIILVRDKTLSKADAAMANEKGISIFTTDKSMYEVCGLLYLKGLTGLPLL